MTKRSIGRRGLPVVLTLAVTSLLWAACGGSGGSTTAAGPSTTPSTAAAPVASTTTAVPDDFVATASDFRNLHTMTKVRGFFVTNLDGHTAEALRIARADKGGVYPVGTLIQLVPTEAMVKRRTGFDPATHDWEFFSLGVSKTGSKILVRGTDKVINRFGGSCASCHAAAEPKFDEVCEHDHGCQPLPVSDAVIGAVQMADPRPTT